MLPWFAFGACSLIWGSTWLAHKWALIDFTPLGLATLRFCGAGILCWIMARSRGEAFARREHWKPLFLAGLILAGLANVLTAWTLLHIPSGVGAVLQAPIPVWLALLSQRTDPLRPIGWLAVCLGFLGVALVMWPEDKVSIAAGPALLCALTAAAWSWASLYQRAQVKSGGLFANASVQMLFSGCVGLLLTPLFGGFTQTTTVSTSAWLSLAYLTIGGSCIAFASYLYLTKVWHPARAGSFSYVNPAIAVLLGALLGGETIGNHLIAGMLIILAAVAALQLATRSPKITADSI